MRCTPAALSSAKSACSKRWVADGLSPTCRPASAASRTRSSASRRISGSPPVRISIGGFHSRELADEAQGLGGIEFLRMPVRLGLGPAMAAGQGAGPGDLPEDQERAVVEVIPVHGGHASGMLAGGGVGHGFK